MSSHSARSTSSSSVDSTATTKSTATCATSTNPAVLRRKQAHGAFKRLKDLMNEVSEYETEYADFDKVMHERDAAIEDLKAITDTLESKDQEISLLKSCRKIDLDDFVAKNEELQEEHRRMVKEHSSAKQAATKELDSYQARIVSLSAEVGRTKDETRLAKAQLEAANEELAQWKAPISHLRPLDIGDLKPNIEGLFHKCGLAAHSYFCGDLPSDILNSREAWENGIRGLNISLGLPPNNSPAAKLMRVAAAMYVLSNELAKTVFRPCLLLDSKEQSAALQETLEKYFCDDQRTRSFMHARLMSTHTPDDRRTVLHRWASAASANASKKLSFMCPDGGTSFITRTRDVFQCAADLWCDLQYVDDDIKIVTLDAYHFPEWEWETLADFGETSQSPEPAFMLFPGFQARDQKTELFRGFVLYKDQEHVAKADSEWRSFQRARMPDLGRGPSAKNSAGRRYSISTNGGLTPPTSPKSSTKEPNPQVEKGAKYK